MSKITLQGIVKYIQGKKTYSIVVCILVVAILKQNGFEIPEYVWAVLAAFGLGFLRSGVKKSGLVDAEPIKPPEKVEPVESK